MIDDSVPEYREVENSVKKSKNGKCQGTDNIYAKQLKYSQSIGLINYIVPLIGLIWTCAQVPVKWLTASITCLYKKGRKSLAENYKMLAIIATVSKVLSVIVMERIREVYEHILMPSQFGFRAEQTDRPLTLYMYYVNYSRMQRDQRNPLWHLWTAIAAYD